MECGRFSMNRVAQLVSGLLGAKLLLETTEVTSPLTANKISIDSKFPRISSGFKGGSHQLLPGS